MPRASHASRALKVGAQPGGGGNFHPGGGGTNFESFSFGPDGFRRSSGGAGPGGRGGGFEDLLRGMFGGRRRSARIWSPVRDRGIRRPSRRADLHASLTITLADAAKGTKTRVHLPTGKDVEVKISAGIASGQQIRLKGQGWPSAAGKVGDALITINVAPHPVFKPDGTDLRLELPITLYEAVLGGKVRVPMLDGAVEPGNPRRHQFRTHISVSRAKASRRKAAPATCSTTVRVVLPERVDDEFAEPMKSWREKKPYDPREGLD